MSNETVITVVGNLTADPELRFTPQGIAVANFTIASTPRTFNPRSGEWEDGDTLFLRASLWRDYAEHVAESLHKGSSVIVQGYLTPTSWTDKDTGAKRSGVELQVQEIGPTLRYAMAKVHRITNREEPGRGGQQQQTKPPADPFVDDEEPPKARKQSEPPEDEPATKTGRGARQYADVDDAF